MDNQPSFDRELLLPILLGGFSILGILIILLIGRLSAARASVIVDETETPFKYIFLGTEPVLSSGTPEASGAELVTDIPFDSPTPGSSVVTPVPGTPVLLTPNGTASPDFPPSNGGGPPGSGTLPANAGTPTRAGTSASGPPPLNAGTYDDSHSFLGFSPGWTSATQGGGECGSTQGTLHVSSTLGSSVAFKFVGWELRLRYQVAPSLGTITIRIDNTNFDPLSQSDSTTHIIEWVSPDPLAQTTHDVSITHNSGGSVNIDCVIIRDALATSTSTATPTRTPTP